MSKYSKNMKTKKQVLNFTLVELLVSLGVFSLIMVVLLQFFVGAQKIWIGSEKKSTIYGDSRATIDLISSMLINNYYSDNGPGFIVNSNNNSDSLRFAVNHPDPPIRNGEPSRNNLFFVNFRLDNGKLMLGTYTEEDDSTKFKEIMFSDDIVTGGNSLKNLAISEEVEVAENIATLEFVPFKTKDNQDVDVLEPDNREGHGYHCPSAIMIKITFLSKEDYEEWNLESGEAKENILRQKGRKFMTLSQINTL